MLVLSSVVHNILSPEKPSRNVVDVEKNEENDSRTWETDGPPKERGINDTSLSSRPTSLILKAEQLDDFLRDTKNPDPTHTYRILPIFSGIMIPFSIMLSIPSLTGHWYIRTGENSVLLESRPNPPLLDAAMGLSMGCGILASACLVVRFAERQIKLMTFLCIVFLTLHDLINIPAVTIFGVEHRFDDGFTYGQSFWFTVCSTIASTATNITLITDYHQTKDFRHSGSGLTHKQRSLVIIVIVLLCYVSIGSLILAIMLKITFIDALYLSVVSIETVGFGDLHPSSTGTRIFTCFYIAGGILNLALAVALSREALLESAAVGFRARLKAVETRQRERHIRSRWRAAVRWRLRVQGHPMWVDDRDDERRQRVGRKRHHHWYSSLLRVWRNIWDEVWREWEDPAWKYVYGPRHKRLNLEALTESQLETAALEAGAPLSELVPKGFRLRGGSRPFSDESQDGGIGTAFPRFDSNLSGAVAAPLLTHVRMGGMVSMLGKFAVAIAVAGGFEHEPQTAATLVDHDGDGDNDVDVVDKDEYPTTAGRGIPFTRTMTMTTVIEDETSLAESLELEERNAFRARLTVALTLFMVFWMAGSAIFMHTENWAFGSAVYFCFVSFTTVGYGDFAPKTPAGRSIFVVWALLGVGTMTILISILAEAYSSRYKSMIKSENLNEAVPNSEDSAGPRPRFFDSDMPTETPEEIFIGRPSIAVGNGLNALSASSSTPRVGRSRGPSVAAVAGLQFAAATSSGNVQQRQAKEGIEGLPQEVLKHVDSMRTLLAILTSEKNGTKDRANDLQVNVSVPQNLDSIITEIEKSLQDMANSAKKAIDTS
ncbi:hypothetical protein CVT25_009953 [Psilocybe cyanescens]|uniref:Potassium channel domain-containing protein n=1 Tax=Psilocybe cyanescens TaxID=93625 RepID=A0A409XCR7_PSICY|nr:hypothetical protein CVT25_009953 [Psilocybe cyanescens]